MDDETVSVFICGVIEDHEFAQEVQLSLQTRGYDSWWFNSKGQQQGGNDWKELVSKVISKAKAAVLITSRLWAVSPAVQLTEMPLIIDRMATDKSFVVIPFHARRCELKDPKYVYRQGFNCCLLKPFNLDVATSKTSPACPFCELEGERDRVVEEFAADLVDEMRRRSSEAGLLSSWSRRAAGPSRLTSAEESSSAVADSLLTTSARHGVAPCSTRHWWSQITLLGVARSDRRITSLDTGFRLLLSPGARVGAQAAPGTLVVDAEGRAAASLVDGSLRVAWVNRYTGKLEEWKTGSSQVCPGARLLAIAMAGNSGVRLVMSSANETVIASLSRVGVESANFRVLKELNYRARDAVFIENEVLIIDESGLERSQFFYIDLDRVECIDAAKLGGKLALAAVGLRGRDRVLLITSIDTDSDGSLVPRELGSWSLDIEAGEIGVVIVRDGGPGRRVLVSDGLGHILQFDVPEVRG